MRGLRRIAHGYRGGNISTRGASQRAHAATRNFTMPAEWRAGAARNDAATAARVRAPP